MTTPKLIPRRGADEPAPDVSLFLAFHAGLRRDFGRLADALDRCTPGDARRRALIDEHTAFLLRALHHHHSTEDEEIWPLLRALTSEAGAVMDRLEAEHRQMDAVIERLSQPRRPAAAQAADLRAMHTLLNGHLDVEEQEIVPLIRRHVSAAWWEDSAKRATKSHGRDLPLVAAWTLDSVLPAEREKLLAAGPPALRVLYRLSWRRAYERRVMQVFG
ncbi:hemerythrin-like domain-containing protein [Streptosporangium becharense]|uniref:Hemerythrin-like domain-containing protein n=1 Tax=Streptosporangium becharense TaxID=1816182 RepID=A0A7W9IML0_9ACTN|nr:hemerythrin domain-containing protein [Streptosporangium becharense]MBB2914627.1 hemerythrin-like domain-containing protein [Streptosporangium becharense]MBB5823472.1 hemerythrin-like domain-containing protein [Streptosporangium becharense]